MHHPTPHAWRGRLRGGWLGIILVPAIAGACSSSGATAPLTASVPPAAAATASIARSAVASTAPRLRPREGHRGLPATS